MIGRQVSHYRILERLGEGGMGVVYLAEDLALRRKVALKFLPPDVAADPEARARLVHEAQAAAALLHPGICPIYEIAEAEGRTFIVMAHLEGVTLQGRLARGPLPAREALEIARGIGEALEAAHAKGIVHRDLKPSNVMLMGDGRPVLMDFGLAHVAGGTKLTRTGTTLGTAAYMSPEQTRGETADARSDLWSLGVVLYEMVSGRLPFKGGNPTAMAFSIVNAEPEPLVVSGLPAGLEGVLTRALAKDPARRYEHARDLVADLAALERDGTAQPAGRRHRTRRASRWLWPAVVGGALVLVVGLGMLGVGGVRERWFGGGGTIRSVAVLPLANLSGNAEQEYFADGMTEALINDLGKIGALRVISRTSVMGYKGTKKPLGQIARELGVEAVMEGTVARSGGRVRISAQLVRVAQERQLWADSYERDLQDVLQLQTDVARAVARSVQVALTPQERRRLTRARVVNPEAYDACLRGWGAMDSLNLPAYLRAEQHFRRSIAIDSTFAPAYAGLARTYDLLVDFEGGVQAKMAGCRLAVEKALALDDELPEAHEALGILRFWSFEWEGAIEQLERARELNPSSALAHTYLALCMRCLGRYEEDLAETRKALAIAPNDRYASAQPGWAEYCGRHFPEAEKEFRAVLAKDPTLPMARAGLGVTLEQEGRLGEAITELTRANNELPLSAFACGRAHALAGAGRAREARAILDSLLRSPKSQAGATDLALVYLALGDRGKALDWVEHGLQDEGLRMLGSAFLIGVDPRFDPLRNEPRFRAALKSVHLDHVRPR